MGDDDGDGNGSLGISISLWSLRCRTLSARVVEDTVRFSIYFYRLTHKLVDVMHKAIALLILRTTLVHMFQSMRCAVAHILRLFCHAISRNRIRSVDMKSIALNHMRTNGRTGWHVPLRMTKIISFIFHSSRVHLMCVDVDVSRLLVWVSVCVSLRCFTPIIIHVHSSHRRTHNR